MKSILAFFLDALILLSFITDDTAGMADWFCAVD